MLRNRIAKARTGGPEFRITPDRVIVEVGEDNSISDVIDNLEDIDVNPLDKSPTPVVKLRRVAKQLSNIGFKTKTLTNIGVVVAESRDLRSVVDNIIDSKDTFSDRAVNRLEVALDEASNMNGRTILGGFKPGMMNFSSDDENKMQANLYNHLVDDSLANELTDAIEEMPEVINARIDFTRVSFGPRSLNIDPFSSIASEKDKSGKTTPQDVIEKIGVDKVWEDETGDKAVAAIFDTSFCEKFFSSSSIVSTFSSEDVDSAFSAPKEGHGTMTAYSMAGNKNESELDYSGVAVDADLMLARLTDSDGNIKYVTEAWDWLIGKVKNMNRPVISNHSYGTPICSTRSRCDSETSNTVIAANSRDDHQAFYAAGNEGIYCGHRLSGTTNGITGINSHPSNITCAALRFDLKDAQTYTSHGFGDCASTRNNPKPDVSCMISQVVPYGCGEIDMSSGIGGSSAGTSQAAPLTAGLATLLASATGNAKKSVIETALEATAKQPRTTQVNLIRGHDARFGYGQVRAVKAFEKAMEVSKDEK